ncbi:MAG: DUF4843 domain-containing protein [Saprospiraceae bacterium]|nr:DUF4843 domain-containing protein [Saprospiraceae bacterium]
MIIFSSIVITSCFKEKDQIYDTEGTLVEFHTSTFTTPAAGRSYPLVAVARGAGLRTQRVNLVGPQRANPETIRFVVDTLTTATAGVHFKLGNDGSFVIPANTSFENCSVEFLAAPRDSGKSVDLILRLEGNGSDIKPSENYRRIGYRISLN